MKTRLNLTDQLTDDLYILHIANNVNRKQALKQLQEMKLIDDELVEDLANKEYFLIYNHQFGEGIESTDINASLNEIFNIPASQNIPIHSLGEVYKEFKAQEKIDIRLMLESTKEKKRFEKLPIYRRTPKVTYAAISVDPENILIAPHYTWTYKNLILAIAKEGSLIERLPKHLITDQMYLLAFKNHKETIKIMPLELQNYKIAFEAISYNNDFIQYISRKLINKKLCLEAYKNASDNLKFNILGMFIPDSETCFEIFKRYGFEIGSYRLIRQIKPTLLTPSIAKIAIELDTRCYTCLSKVFRSPEISLQDYGHISIITKSPDSFKDIPENLRTESVSFAAVCASEENLSLVPESAMSDRIILRALKENATLFGKIPISRRTPKICKFAIEYAEGVIKYVLPHIPKKIMTASLRQQAVEKSIFSLSLIEEKFRTKKMCRYAYKKANPVKDENMYVISYIPFSDILLEAMKFYKDYESVEDMLNFADKKLIDDKIADWVMIQEPEAFSHLPVRLQTRDRALLAAKTGCAAIKYACDAVQIPDVYMEALKADPQNYFRLNSEKFTPEIILFIYKNCTTNQDKDNLRHKYGLEKEDNIFYFNLKLEDKLGNKIDYETTLKIYQGENTIIDKLETPDGIKKNVRISFDHSTYKLEIQSDGAAICNCTIRNNVEEYLKNNTPSNPSPGNKDQCLSK